MKPLIGITCSRLTGGAWGMYSLGHFMDYALSDYSQAILHAGGAPVIIPAAQDSNSLSRILDSVQGLILSGGPDVHPKRYGEEPMAGLGEVDEALDAMELMAAGLALGRDIPILGICRGIQVLNIALGGTLYQDIPSQVPDSLCHNPKTDKAVNTHTVRIEVREPPAPHLRQARDLGERQAPPGVKRVGTRAGCDGAGQGRGHRGGRAPGQALCHRGPVASRGHVAG